MFMLRIKHDISVRNSNRENNKVAYFTYSFPFLFLDIPDLITSLV